MSDTSKTLLPEGLRDLLPPEAAVEAEVIHTLTQSFGANGYALVKPPLAEFEDTLLAGVGQVLRDRIFRMPDPVSHRSLGFRADVTTQVARIATTRLASQPRPLRLMYAGQVLRVRGDQLEPERQFTQAGIELIGAETGAADAEVILATTEALEAVGVKNLTVDLALPTLVPAILKGHGVDANVRLPRRARPRMSRNSKRPGVQRANCFARWSRRRANSPRRASGSANSTCPRTRRRNGTR